MGRLVTQKRMKQCRDVGRAQRGGAGSSSWTRTLCPGLGPPQRHREGRCHSPSKAAGDRVGREEGAQHVGQAWGENRENRFIREGKERKLEGKGDGGGGGREIKPEGNREIEDGRNHPGTFPI